MLFHNAVNHMAVTMSRVLCWLAGTAYIHGIKHATGNCIVLMDADLSHHVCVSLVLLLILSK